VSQRIAPSSFLLLAYAGLALALSGLQVSGEESTNRKPTPMKLIFDTDIGNDVDDVLALSILHALQSRGDSELLAVTVTKADELARPFVDAVNSFYGRPSIPIGCIRKDPDKQKSKFLSLVETTDDGQLRYPHRLKRSSDAPEATHLLRKVLSEQTDGSVTMIQVGFFSNLAALLRTSADTNCPLTGLDLVKRKVKLLSVMAGAFRPVGNNNHRLEFNVAQDIASARVVAEEWPTPIVWSGYEIGLAVLFPASSIERDFSYVQHHPVAEAYYLYKPPPHERPSWDLTSVLYAVLGDRNFFELSAPGVVTIAEDGFTRFDPSTNGHHRFLELNDIQAVRVREALVQLASQPPDCLVTKRQ